MNKYSQSQEELQEALGREGGSGYGLPNGELFSLLYPRKVPNTISSSELWSTQHSLSVKRLDWRFPNYFDPCYFGVGSYVYTRPLYARKREGLFRERLLISQTLGPRQEEWCFP